MPDRILTARSVTDALSLADVLARLAGSDLIDGLAFYGPPAARPPGSDFDLLALVSDRPHGLSHIATTIDRCPTDVLFIDTATFDELLAGTRRLAAGTVEAIVLQKLPRAEILADRSGRLARGRDLAAARGDLLRVPGYSGRYLLWFAQNFSLAQIERLSQSDDPIYRTTTQLLLGSAIARTCHAYFDLRQLPWEGEKRALMQLAAADPEALALLRQSLAAAAHDLPGALTAYRALVARAIEPFGPLWPRDALAASFSAPVTDAAPVAAALARWTALFT